jgi:phosphoglycolate phosphatase-like HAD superfamily hydrolase
MRDVSARAGLTYSLNMTEKKPRRLVLFDIDSTLINTGGAGVQALKLATEGQFGIGDDLSGVEIAGRTDSGIVRQILAKHGTQPTDEELRRFFDIYIELLARQLPICEGHVLPGIVELLERLESRPHITLGLLTGNLARGAQLKLEHYALWKYFPFGAFADDHHDRNELGLVACARALEHTGWQFAPSAVDVIGDTEHDVACGKAIGARTIAVATGSRPRERLAESEPDFLFDDFSRTNEVVAKLGW